MRYEVLTVDDDALPAGVESVIVERPEAVPLLIVSGRPAEVWRWMRSYEDAHEPAIVPTMLRAVPRLAG